MKKSMLTLFVVLLNISVALALDTTIPPETTLQSWLKEDAGKAMAPHPVATLATSVNNQPSVRIIQTFVDENGVIEFYTHANTEKAKAQKINPKVAVNFWLSQARKQISIEGKMVPLETARLDEIWQTMPRWMQLSFIASDHQSPLPHENYLKEKITELEQSLGKDIARPKEFVGFIIEPTKYDFYAVKMPEPAEKFRAVKNKKEWHWQQLQP